MTGICGPHSIGAVTGIPYQTVILDWFVSGLGYYKGYAPLREIRAMLNFYDFKHKFASAHGSKSFELPEQYSQAIARIQWLPDGDDEGQMWDSWQQAQQHTHYVALKRIGNRLQVNCDGQGLFEANESNNKVYLDHGIITSYLYIL